MRLAQIHTATPTMTPNTCREILISTQAANLRTQANILRDTENTSRGITVRVQEVGQSELRTCSFSVITGVRFTKDLLVIEGLDNSGRHVTETFKKPSSLNFSRS